MDIHPYRPAALAGPEKTKGEQTAERILRAAARCIATLGVERTSVTEIAKRAKTSRGLVAHYFPQKSELFMEVIHWIRAQAIPSVEAAAGPATPEERLLRSIDENFRFFIENPDFYLCFTLFYYYAGVRKDFRRLHSQTQTHALRRTVEYLKEYCRAHEADLSARDLEIHARAINAESSSMLRTYFFVDHGLSDREFLLRHRESQQWRLRALLATAL